MFGRNGAHIPVLLILMALSWQKFEKIHDGLANRRYLFLQSVITDQIEGSFDSTCLLLFLRKMRQ